MTAAHTDGTEVGVLHLDAPPGVDPADNELGWNEVLDRLAAPVEDSDPTHRDRP